MIDIPKAFTYFQNKFLIKKSSKGWFKFDCPYCEKSKAKNAMAVKFDSETVKCWNVKCPWGQSSIAEFVADRENLDGIFEAKMFILDFEPTLIDLVNDFERRSVEKIDIKELPTGFHTILSGEGILAKRARNYLERRNFDLQLLDKKGFGYCNEHHMVDGEPVWKEDYYGYIIVPFKRRGKLVYYIGRDFLDRGEKEKYKNPSYEVFGIEKSDIIYNEDALDKYSTVFLNEGWADAETVGKEGIASLGWKLSPKQKTRILRSQIKRLVIVADRGAYENAVKTSIPFLKDKEVFVVNFDVPELAEFGKDINEVGLDRFYKAYQKTTQMDLKKAMSVLRS